MNHPCDQAYETCRVIAEQVDEADEAVRKAQIRFQVAMGNQKMREVRAASKNFATCLGNAAVQYDQYARALREAATETAKFSENPLNERVQ